MNLEVIRPGLTGPLKGPRPGSGTSGGDMPVTWAVEPQALVLLFKGKYGAADIERALTEGLSKASGLPLLLDVRQAAAIPTAIDTQHRLDLMRLYMPPLQPRIAVMTADAARAGAARVMKVQAERVGVEFQVFGPWELDRARLWLSKDPQHAPPIAKVGGESESPTRGSETVLLVDDDDALRELTREVLTELGYSVLEARSASAALDAVALHGGAVHLLLTDLMMPGMNGRELWRALAPLHPEAKALFMSGYGQQDIVRHGVLKPETALLQKPFSHDALARAVRAVLGAIPEGPRLGLPGHSQPDGPVPAE
jgi:CheY-like chemotaxis protein